jgi:hypothetical protein
MLKKLLKNINLSSLIKHGRFHLRSGATPIKSSLFVINHNKSFSTTKDESNSCITVEEQSQEGEPEKIQINCKRFFNFIRQQYKRSKIGRYQSLYHSVHMQKMRTQNNKDVYQEIIPSRCSLDQMRRL